MPRYRLPGSPIQRTVVAAVSAALVATFAIAARGMFLADEPKGHDLPAPVSVVAEAPARPAPPAADPAQPPQAAPLQSSSSFAVRRVLTLDAPLRHGDWAWDDTGVPPGPTVITVDLKAETLSVFRGGYEIGVAAILFGATDKPSPTGVFPIMEKDADHVSSTYNNAPMPYMLRLTGDGVAIHGSEVEWGYATHGCIGVPIAFARKLFGAARVGDVVIVTSGRMMKTG